MSNDYLLKVALQDPSRLSLDLILQLYRTASQFEIFSLLTAYTSHLLTRINKSTLLTILQFLLLCPPCLSSQSHSSYSQSDFVLLLQSVSVLISSLKGVFHSVGQDPRQMIILHEIFDKLFQLPLRLQEPKLRE
jgi:hypothetical protein